MTMTASILNAEENEAQNIYFGTIGMPKYTVRLEDYSLANKKFKSVDFNHNFVYIGEHAFFQLLYFGDSYH